MAHHKSALKRIKQNKKRYERNKHVRTTLRTFIKESLAAAIPVIDSAASKGVIHRSNASRNISRLTKLVNTMEA